MNQETPEEKKLRIERQIDDANAYVAWAKRFGKFPLLKTAIATRGAAIGPRVALNKLRRKIDPIDPEYAKLLDLQASQITKRVSPEEAARLEKSCPCAPTYLYLVSAEKEGIQYWKVGITEKENVLKRDPQHYREVFRKTSYEWKTHAQDVETAIAGNFRGLNEVAEEEGYEIVKPPSKEALAYSFSLESALEIYDWWVELSRTSDQVSSPFPDSENRPSYSFSYYSDAKVNMTKFQFARPFFDAPSRRDKRVKNQYRHHFNCYTKLKKTYHREGTEEHPFLNRYGTGVFYRETRAGIHYYFQLIDWLEPHARKLGSYRPDRIPSTSKTNPPEWD